MIPRQEERREKRDRAVGASAALLSPSELATYLAVPLATVYRWRSRREGPVGLRVGKHVRYRVDDVERWLDLQRDPRS